MVVQPPCRGAYKQCLKSLKVHTVEDIAAFTKVNTGTLNGNTDSMYNNVVSPLKQSESIYQY